MNIILLPFYILKFWYLEAPLRLIGYFWNLNRAFLHLFSLPLMLRTFFVPWKNEYREGIIWFSIFMGMFFKSVLIVVDMFLLMFLLVFELTSFIIFLLFPLLIFYLPFIRLI